MKAIKNRLNKLNKLAVVDEVDTVFLTQIDTGHFEVRYRIGGKNPKDIIEVYPPIKPNCPRISAILLYF